MTTTPPTSGSVCTITITDKTVTPNVNIIADMCVNSIGDLSYTKNTQTYQCYGPNEVEKIIEGKISGGDFAIGVLYASATEAAGLFTAFKNLNKEYEVVLSINKSSTEVESWTFNAKFVGLSGSFPIDNYIGQTITLHPTGVPTIE